MEEPVYDSATRWLGSIVIFVLFIPLTAFLLWLRMIDQKSSSELLIVAWLLAILNAGLFLVLHLATNVWITIDLTGRRVLQRYKIFGWAVY